MLLTTTEVAASTAATTTTATAVITTTAATATEVAARAIKASAAATTAWRTVFAGTGFVDCEGTAIEIFAVELLNGCLSIGIGCHRNEGESA